MRKPVSTLPTEEICRVATNELVPLLETLAKSPGANPPKNLQGVLHDAAAYLEEMCKRLQAQSE